MYEIIFRTRMEIPNPGKWSEKLYSDFIRAINCRKILCTTKEEALQKLQFVAGKTNCRSEKGVCLESPAYGKQYVDLQIPGFPQGYVDMEKQLSIAEEKGRVIIPFVDFYDSRQKVEKSLFRECYLDIYASSR